MLIQVLTKHLKHLTILDKQDVSAYRKIFKILKGYLKNMYALVIPTLRIGSDFLGCMAMH